MGTVVFRTQASHLNEEYIFRPEDVKAVTINVREPQEVVDKLYYTRGEVGYNFPTYKKLV